jgi:hypothetical protein
MASEKTYEEVCERFEEVRKQVDALITEQFKLHCDIARMEGECLPKDMTLTEFMVVCAWQAFNERGHRGGDVRLLLRDGAMPTYTARGLLSSACAYVEQIAVCTCGIQEEEDGEA